VDYIINLFVLGCRALKPVIKGTKPLR